MRGAGDTAQELNQFLAAHRILAIDRHLVADGANNAWAICVSFDENGADTAPQPAFGKRGNVDFKDILNADEFAVCARCERNAPRQAGCRPTRCSPTTSWRKWCNAGRITASGLQSDYASALALTLHADATAWRRERLRRYPVEPALEAL